LHHFQIFGSKILAAMQQKSAAQLAQRSIANVLVITNNTYLIAQRLFCYFAVTALA